jgi:hypothetical protein
MASFSVIMDATKPLNTSNWIATDSKPLALTKEQKAALGNYEQLTKSNPKVQPVPEDMDVERAIQESVPWTEVKRKISNSQSVDEKLEEVQSMKEEEQELSMKKVKVTFAVRVPKDTSNFSPAKLHIEALHEIHKFDESLIVFNHSGERKVNFETSMTDLQYKETFHPVEKRIGRNPGWISITHEIYITNKASECKEAIFPYLKKNKIFLYINQKPGLEHFAAIGVLFGPNPDYTWRDELATLLIETIKPIVTEDEKQILGVTATNEPKLILSLNIQTIGNKTNDQTTTSVALEVRVPTEHKKIYIDIIERLYEKEQDEEIIVPNKLGKFFPYYMKAKKPEVFSYLMRQQNSEMSNTTIIPIFGYTPEVQKQQITIDGESTTVELAMATTKHIIRLEATPSTWNLHKYLVIVSNDKKSSVMKEIQQIFRQIEGPLPNQPPNFPVPRCGGSEKTIFKEQKPNIEEIVDKTTSSYMVSLETLALAHNPQDSGPTSPPKRHRKLTISYANAAKAGIIKNSETPSEELPKNQTNGAVTPESANTQEPNQSTENSKKDIDSELQKIKNSLESRMQKQEDQMAEIVQVIKTMNEDFKKRMIHVVLAALSKEKEKVQELTHGRVHPAPEAPLADDAGNLPYGGKVQLGGPLDRLHHVEVTIVQMSNALDSILEHLQKDPTAKYLFEDSESETSTIIENQIQLHTKENSETDDNLNNSDVQMVPKDISGSKRQLTYDSPAKNRHGPDPKTKSPPQNSPPLKHPSKNSKPSANPEDRERGQN